MLNRISVSNLAIVEKAEAEFAPGLNVITGETGSGKSVLMGALELALGGKADASAVRDGAKEAEVEADFGDVVVRRVVGASGRSRAWINDEAVSVSDLRDLGRRLVDIHGPHSNQNILEEYFQRDTLDAYSGDNAAKERYREAWEALVAVRDRIAALESDKSGARVSVEEELDLLRYQVDELESARLTTDDEDIAERHAAAAHAEDIIDSANEITEALGGDGSVSDTLSRLMPKFAAIARHLPEAEEWSSQAEELAVRVQELSRTVADTVSRLDCDPDEFAELDARLGVVNKLKRKYMRGEGTVADLISLLEEKKARLDDLENRDARIAELRKEEKAAEGKVAAVGAELTKARRKGGSKLATAVTKELRDLGFLQAKFFVELSAAEPESHGCDHVVFMFEPNPGETARPLSDIASSGETARVMLAMKSVLAAHDSVGLLVFDEIDANIGGEAGRVVGEKMRGVAKHRQVIAITHLPQSAVYGDRHLVVTKAVSGGRTRTSVDEVTGAARTAEIARMLGGAQSTSVVMKHAEELLETARR